MSRNRNTNKILKSLSGNAASFLPGEFYFLPNRFFLPGSLFQTTCQGKNLHSVGSKLDEIIGGSIAFSEDDCIISTFGEYVERYSASFDYQKRKDIIPKTSYDEMYSMYNMLDFKYLNLYRDDQFSQKFPFKKITIKTPLDWVKGYCHISKKEIYVPCEFVFMPYNPVGVDQRNWAQTSTGLAAHTTTSDAIKGGYLECEERNAFCQWWYLQNSNEYFIKYTQLTVFEKYKANIRINSLFGNNKVSIITYDLGRFSNVETIVCFMTFTYKGKVYKSLGCSSRFEKEDAIIKACLEAYQGVDYAILLCKREKWIEGADTNFNEINGFDKHFAFYNYYPSFRKEVPLFNDLLNDNYQEIEIFKNKVKNFDFNEIEDKSENVQNVISVNITTGDVKSLGFEVVRVLIPGYHLLTGRHSIPYLGFFNETDLFLEFPHPFP